MSFSMVRTIQTLVNCRITTATHKSVVATSINTPSITLTTPTNPHHRQTQPYSSRSYRGLYDGVDIRTGNKVSFSMRKTKRKFKPNVFKKRLYSEILDETIQFNKVSAKALRTMDKMGGLDEYLLNSPFVWRGSLGWKVKERILERMEEMEEEKEGTEAHIMASDGTSQTEKI